MNTGLGNITLPNWPAFSRKVFGASDVTQTHDFMAIDGETDAGYFLHAKILDGAAAVNSIALRINGESAVLDGMWLRETRTTRSSGAVTTTLASMSANGSTEVWVWISAPESGSLRRITSHSLRASSGIDDMYNVMGPITTPASSVPFTSFGFGSDKVNGIGEKSVMGIWKL